MGILKLRQENLILVCSHIKIENIFLRYSEIVNVFPHSRLNRKHLPRSWQQHCLPQSQQNRLSLIANHQFDPTRALPDSIHCYVYFVKKLAFLLVKRVFFWSIRYLTFWPFRSVMVVYEEFYSFKIKQINWF